METTLLILVLGFVVGVAVWAVRKAALRMDLLGRYSQAALGEEELPYLPAPLPGALGRLQRDMTRMAELLRERLNEARSGQQRLEAVLSGMIEGVLVIDSRGTVVLSNRRAEQLFQLPAGESSVGRALIEVTRHPDLHQIVGRALEEGYRAGPLSEEVAIDGPRHQVLQVTVTPISGAAGGLPAFILVCHDITELKRLEESRRDFVANVSHELRTPLAAIRGYSETLLEGALDDPRNARRFLGIIERHADRLGRLVDDLLTLSDLELGRTEMQRRPIRVEGVVETACEVLRGRAEQAGVTLRQDLATDVPLVDGDSDRLVQTLVNLVDNAVKYTPAGGRVTVGVHRADLPAIPGLAARSYVEVSVADTGPGIPSHDLPRLTERFYRVDKARSRELGGTGLGLAIVKHIVQAHGGHLEIDSELNRGTTVRVFLPVRA